MSTAQVSETPVASRSAPIDRPLRIVYLSGSGALGGAELDLVDIAASLRTARPDWELSAVLGDEGPLGATLEYLGVPCTILPLPERLSSLGDAGLRDLRGAFQLALRGPGAAASAFGYLRRLRQVLRTARPDWVQTNDMKSHILGAWSRPRGVPVAWFLQDYIGSRPVMSRLLRRSSGSAKRIFPVAISNSVATDAEQVLGSRVGNLPTIYPAIDLERFSPGEGDGGALDRASNLPKAPEGLVRVGLVATFARWKGHEVVLEAAAKLARTRSEGVDPPFRFYIIGGPIYRTIGSQYSLEELRALASRLGLDGQVGFTGHQSDPASAIRSLDVVIHASTRPEPFGRVIAEAMACGKALVAVGRDGPAGPAGGSAELFEDGVSALACPSGDPEALAEAVGRLIADPGLRRSLGEAGRQTTLKRFERSRLARDWAPFYLDQAAIDH
ncbi:glycosyltransferase family 4 protein [soil metagenome]